MDTELRSLALYASLGLVGLAIAAWAWLGDDRLEIRVGAVAFARCDEDDLKAVALEVGARKVALTFAGDRATVSLTRRMSRALLPPSAVTQTETLTMAGNTQALRLRSRFAPAMAKRALGAVTPLRLKVLGLKNATEVLRIQCGSATQRFVVGTTSYGGGGRYVQNQSDGTVWLVDPTLISDVRLADSRFVERRLVSHPPTRLERAEVNALGRTRMLLHRNHRSLKQSEWVDAAAPTQRNERYGNWLAKLLQLRAISWLSGTPLQARTPVTRQLVVNVRPVVTVTFSGERAERVELWRGEDALSGKGKQEATVHYWARSGATGGWVSVSRGLGQQLAEDVATLVGAPVTVPVRARPTRTAPLPNAPSPNAPSPNAPGQPPAEVTTPEPAH